MLALKQADGVGGVLFRQLLSYFGSAKEVLSASDGKLLKVPGIGKAALASIKEAGKHLNTAENELRHCEKHGYKIITFLDKDYPQRFKGLYDMPPLIYFSGSHDLNYTKTIGIVGTRKATDYGKMATERMIEELADQQVCVVSGLAYGIDIAAHKAAIKYGLPTLAVMAGGLDYIYPAAHKKYIEDIKNNGGLVSENKTDNIPIGPQFIARNRIIAALSDAILVVESAKRGGGLVTAECGNNYNREVYAVPGAVGQPYSEGPNNLIRSNKAKIYLSAQQLIEDLNWDLPDTSTTRNNQSSELDLTRFTGDESRILSILKKEGECLIDNLSFQSNIPLNKLASLLLNLEFQDLVKALPGKKFKLK